MSLDRRAALAAYKERKPNAGIFALRTPEGAVFVGSAATLDTVENRHRFTLRQGSHPNTALQQAVAASASELGEGAVTFEVLERLSPEISEMTRPRVLKERLAYWQAHLGALRL